MHKMHDLADAHMIGNDRIIEIGFRQRILIHFRNILFLHECRVCIGKRRDCRLQCAVGMCRADTEALSLCCLNIRTVAVSAKRGFSRSYAQKQRIDLLPVCLSQTNGDQIPVLINFLVERILDLLYAHGMIDRTDLLCGSIRRRIALTIPERIADALRLHIPCRVMRHLLRRRSR